MSRLLLVFALLAVLAVSAAVAEVGQWAQWRGPNRDGICLETGLLDEWPSEGPSLLWQASGLGNGYSSVAISEGRIYTLGARRGGAVLIALDEKDGRELWSANVGGGKPNCTPTVDGNLVFAVGVGGDLVCVDGTSGRELWRKNFAKDFGGKMMSGYGYSESPLVDGNLLICTPGAQDAMIAALNKRTGSLVWKSPVPDLGRRGNDGAAYSSIVVSEACGVKQYVQLTGKGVVSVAAKDGRFLWSYNRVANDTANIPTPIVKDDYVFCSSGYGTGSALLKVERAGSQLGVEEVYFLDGNTAQNHHGGMVLVGDHIYMGHGHNNGFPLCLRMADGEITWKPGRGAGDGSAAVLYADGHLYFRYENGIMALIEADPSEYKLKSSFKLASVKDRSWPHPVISDGKLYLRDQDTLMCYDVRK